MQLGIVIIRWQESKQLQRLAAVVAACVAPDWPQRSSGGLWAAPWAASSASKRVSEARRRMQTRCLQVRKGSRLGGPRGCGQALSRLREDRQRLQCRVQGEQHRVSGADDGSARRCARRHCCWLNQIGRSSRLSLTLPLSLRQPNFSWSACRPCGAPQQLSTPCSSLGSVCGVMVQPMQGTKVKSNWDWMPFLKQLQGMVLQSTACEQRLLSCHQLPTWAAVPTALAAAAHG